MVIKEWQKIGFGAHNLISNNSNNNNNKFAIAKDASCRLCQLHNL